MSDPILRSLSRAALSGSPSDQARALTARLRVAPGCEACGGRGWQLLSSNLPGAPSHACVACAGTGSPLRARIELAAYCGDEGARLALPRYPADNRHTLEGKPLAGETMVWGAYRGLNGESWAAHPLNAFPSWLSGLSRWSDIGPAPGWVMVRAAVAAAWTVVAQHESHTDAYRPAPAELLRARRAVEAAEAWLECPCEEHREAWGMSMTGELARDWLPWPPFSPSAPGTRERDAIGYRGRIEGAAHLAGESPVRAAICSSLVEWGLGGDQ